MEELRKQINILKDSMNNHIHNNLDGTTKLNHYFLIKKALTSTQAQTSSNYGVFFVATRPCFIKAISEVHTVAGTDAGAVELQIERLQGITTLGSGDNVLLTPFDLKGTANTSQRGSLITTNKTILSLRLGDRLALKDTGTLTSLEGVCVTVELQF